MKIAGGATTTSVTSPHKQIVFTACQYSLATEIIHTSTRHCYSMEVLVPHFLDWGYCTPTSWTGGTGTPLLGLGVLYPHFLDWRYWYPTSWTGGTCTPLLGLGVLYLHFSGWKGEEFAVICCHKRLNYNKTVFGQGSAPEATWESMTLSQTPAPSQMEGILSPHSPPLSSWDPRVSQSSSELLPYFLDQSYPVRPFYSNKLVLINTPVSPPTLTSQWVNPNPKMGAR